MDIYVTEIKIENDDMKLFTDKTTEGMTTANRMIVDSDNFSFIYLLDNGEMFTRLHFVEETWSMLEDHKGKRLIVNDDIELTDFWDEMNDLLENIEGNNNYGQAFEEAVLNVLKQNA